MFKKPDHSQKFHPATPVPLSDNSRRMKKSLNTGRVWRDWFYLSISIPVLCKLYNYQKEFNRAEIQVRQKDYTFTGKSDETHGVIDCFPERISWNCRSETVMSRVKAKYPI